MVAPCLAAGIHSEIGAWTASACLLLLDARYRICAAWPRLAPLSARGKGQRETREQIVASMPQRPEIRHEEARAYDRPAADTVNMPARSLFPRVEHYYSILFHELTHSTGHASRLDRATLRDLLAFGDTNYSKEELCAEMGAAYLCGVAGIVNETVTNSAAYIQGWLNKLRNDKKLLVQAAAQAQKAADFILGKETKQE